MLQADQLRSAARLPARSLCVETRLALPIPVRTAGRCLIAILAARESFGQDRKLRFVAPDYVIYLDPEDGHLIQMKAVEPSDFGQPHQPGEIIGGWGVNELPNTPDEITQMWKNLIAALDVLLPVYVEDRRITDEVRQAARTFLRLFDIVGEKAFRPYYRALGKDFFAWLDRIAR